MSVKKFKFVSPGVFTKEIDQSQLQKTATSAGPVIIGRLPQGPAMEPVQIDSFSDFVQVFGDPVPGKATGDVWRDGNYQGPTYASYAAQAYLRNSTDGINVIRLAGLKSKDVSTDGEAGWETTTNSGAIASNGGAFGLFLVNPSGTSGTTTEKGYLAAIWYIHSGGAMGLSGTLAAGVVESEGMAGLFNPAADSGNSNGPDYIAYIKDTAGTKVYQTTFNFDPSSRTFIRKVFNTNPQTVGAVVPTTNFKNGENLYWLGESYESFIQGKLNSEDLKKDAYGLMLPLDQTNKANYRKDYQSSQTGWFFSQDLSTDWAGYNPANMQKLFRLVSLEPGKWIQDKLKISIQDLTYSRSTSGVNLYGSFTVIIRRADDTDKVIQTVERFSNVNLNPLSDNYIGKKIGDKYSQWDQDNKIMREYGEYSNASKYVRVEVDPTVRNGIASTDLLPFGVYGPDKFDTVVLGGTSISPADIIEDGNATPDNLSTGTTIFNKGAIATGFSASIEFPELTLRNSSSAGDLFTQTDAYYGLAVSAYMENTTDGWQSDQPDPGYGDYLYPNFAPPGKKEPQWLFSLDDVIQLSGKDYSNYSSGSRAQNLSLSASGSWRTTIDNGWSKFTAPLYGGFDGLDITEIEPFRNTKLNADTNRNTNYAMNTIRTAIEVITDPEMLDCDLAVIPGITSDNITRNLIETCAARADCLAIIDIPNAYTPFTEDTSSYSNPDKRNGSVSEAVTAIETRELNNSYGCTYYPWVQIQDTVTSNSRVWVPPSVVALGTFASSDTQSEVWFAPAGFNRGGLTAGSSGLPVLNVSQRLTSKDRDALYDAGVNPIASFPNEGIVIFGQKTLQATPSALDRINVRRMMIFVKKQISLFANTILFDQNVEVTWNRFKALAEPFLASVQTRLGLSDYKLILDSTTTTPDLVDRNIVYAKIFLKPARAIEYIALDFVITNSGASFED